MRSLKFFKQKNSLHKEDRFGKVKWMGGVTIISGTFSGVSGTISDLN